jgi:hypothetical protein
MFLFTRQVVVSPAHLRAGLAHSLEMLSYVNEKTDLDVSLFQVLQGAPLGTLTYAYRTDSYAASVEASDVLTGSNEYLEKVESGAGFFVGNPQDRLGNIIHLAGEVNGPPGAAAIVSARLEIHKARKAIGWSVELADYLANATGVPTAVLTSNMGEYGTISWLSYGESLKQLEEANSKTNADPGFLKQLEDSKGYFVPGSGTGVLSRKIG